MTSWWNNKVKHFKFNHFSLVFDHAKTYVSWQNTGNKDLQYLKEYWSSLELNKFSYETKATTIYKQAEELNKSIHILEYRSTSVQFLSKVNFPTSTKEGGFTKPSYRGRVSRSPPAK